MSVLVETVLRASVEGAVVVLGLWLVTRLTPAMPPRVRTWLWWLVTARLLLALTPVPAVEVPWGYEAQAEGTSASMGVMHVTPHAAVTEKAWAGDAVAARVPARPGAGPVAWSITWRDAAIAGTGILYILGLAWQLAALCQDLHRNRRLTRHAQPVPHDIDERATAIAAAMHMPAPSVRTSPQVRSPRVIGAVRPTVVLPSGASAWPARDLDLALAHELAHVRRHDLLWAWVPALAQRVFFFHPLARLAVREYVLAREAACDAEAVTRMRAEARDYGRLLITLGCAPASPLSAAAGATTFNTLKRRLVMLERATTPVSRWWWALVGVAAITLVPLTLVATPLPPAPSAPAAVSAATPADTQVDEPPPPPPPPPTPPAPPVPPVPPMPPTTRVQSSGSQAVDRTPWVLFEAGDEGQSVRAANREDIDEARRHRQGSEAMVWFRHNGVAYVSRNAQLLDGLRESFATVHAIGERLSAAGARQGLEGARQGQVGERQGALGAEMGRHGARIAELTGQLLVIEGERLQAADRQMTAEQATRRAALRAELDKVEREMRTLGGQQRELAREMEGNAAQMREESTKMEALGAEMRRAVDEAMRRVSGLFDKAVSEGTARPAM